MDYLDVMLTILQVYFLLMNVTVERFYCQGPAFKAGDSRFLVAETIAFCEVNNRLFLQRPDWMVTATCFSAYCLSFGYLLIVFTTWTNLWRRLAVPLLLLCGVKLNAILFYHVMEFTSASPPEHLAAYFSVEGPYILSMGLVILKVSQALYAKGPRPKAE